MALVEALFLGVGETLAKVIIFVAFTLFIFLIFGAGYAVFEIIKGNRKIGLILVSILVLCLGLSKITGNVGGIILFILIMFGVIFFRLIGFVFRIIKK